MTLTIDKNNDKISNTKFVWDDKKMVYKLNFDYTFACNSGLTVHYEMTIHKVSLYHDRTDGHSFLIWNDIDVFEFDDDETIFEEELDDSERDMLFDGHFCCGRNLRAVLGLEILWTSRVARS